MLKTIICDNKNYEKKLLKYISNGEVFNENRKKIVSNIIEDVRQNGDIALIKYTKKFEKKIYKNSKDFLVSQEEIEKAAGQCSKDFHKSINLAVKRIKSYQNKIFPKTSFYKDKQGIKLGCIWSALSSCGLYVPGGKALYPSSVLMNAVPAQIAGVKRIVVVTPVLDKKISPEILVACKASGVTEIYKVGGVQAVAALAYGTKSIKKVDKIVGPGNAYVAEAKKQVYGQVGIDSIAGPSEVLIIADSTCNAKWIAIDLISQAEHDEEARAILITDNSKLINEVKYYLGFFINRISRSKIAKKSLLNNGLAILIDNIDESYKIANFLAPEHLEIMSKNKKKLFKKITNAGAIFLGNYTPEALGDYVAGPSHVLPTSGNARFESGLSVIDFLKRTSYIEANKNGLNKVAKAIQILGESEGLDAHVKSALIRFSKD